MKTTMTLDAATLNYLAEKRGTLRLNKRGRIEIEAYVLRDESKADTYANRHWYQAAVVEGTADDIVALARTHFGTGRLREMTDYLDGIYGARRWSVLR